jgi:hypothetical protein
VKRQEQRVVDRPISPRPTSPNVFRDNIPATVDHRQISPHAQPEEPPVDMLRIKSKLKLNKPVGTATPQIRDHSQEGPKVVASSAPRTDKIRPTPIPHTTKKQEVKLPPSYKAEVLSNKPIAPEGWLSRRPMNLKQIKGTSTEALKKAMELLIAGSKYEDDLAEWNERNMQEICKAVDSENERRRILLGLGEVKL